MKSFSDIRGEYFEVTEHLGYGRGIYYFLLSLVHQSDLDELELKKVKKFILWELQEHCVTGSLESDHLIEIPMDSFLLSILKRVLSIRKNNRLAGILLAKIYLSKEDFKKAANNFYYVFIDLLKYSYMKDDVITYSIYIKNIIREYDADSIVDDIFMRLNRDKFINQYQSFIVNLLENYFYDVTTFETVGNELDKSSLYDIDPLPVSSITDYLSFGSISGTSTPKQNQLINPEAVYSLALSIYSEDAYEKIVYMKEEEDLSEDSAFKWLRENIPEEDSIAHRFREDNYTKCHENNACYTTEYEYSIEVSYVITLDENFNLIGAYKLAEGNDDSVYVPFRELIRLAHHDKAKFVIKVHNHPGDDSNPSVADLKICRHLKLLTKNHNITLLDNFIISTHGYYSFRKNGLL